VTATPKLNMNSATTFPTEPILPFEPKSAQAIPSGEQWIAQVKWDGVRILTYYDGNQVRLFNRRKNERTFHYPELVQIKDYCQASSIILDGEVIALRAGKPSFQTVMKRDGVRRLESIEKARAQVPILYMIFDVLYCDGKWVTDWPLRERQQLLQKMIKEQPTIQVVQNFDNIEGIYAAVKAQDLEGLVCKNLNKPYQLGGKDDRWIKLKYYKDLYAVIAGVTYNQGIVNAVLLGLYDHEQRLHYIGHAGTGKLKAEEWRILTQLVQPLIISERPFINQPERAKDATWLKPKLTVKIKYMEWTHGGTLRQPSIQAFVTVPLEDCSFEQ